MSTRWSANTWVLVVFVGILVLAGVDAVRRAATPTQAAPNTNEPEKPPTEPPFKVGDAAPEFTLPDSKGQPHALRDVVKKDTLLAFTCGCNNCRQIETQLGTLLPKLKDPPEVLTVTSMGPEAEGAWIRDTKLKHLILFDDKKQNTPVIEAWKGHPCPRLFRLSADRKVTWIGPSMAAIPQPEIALPRMADDMAHQLGFTVKGEAKVPGKPVAPDMEDVTRTASGPMILPQPPKASAPVTKGPALEKKVDPNLPPYAGKGLEAPL